MWNKESKSASTHPARTRSDFCHYRDGFRCIQLSFATEHSMRIRSCVSLKAAKHNHRGVTQRLSIRGPLKAGPGQMYAHRQHFGFLRVNLVGSVKRNTKSFGLVAFKELCSSYRRSAANGDCVLEHGRFIGNTDACCHKLNVTLTNKFIYTNQKPRH